VVGGQGAPGAAGGVGEELRCCGPSPERQLWVSKYAPRRFMDLLSDSLTNRRGVFGFPMGWHGVQ
jgi:hypothetical protein